MERWSLSEKQIYGAEDDEDMDAIMAALDANAQPEAGLATSEES